MQHSFRSWRAALIGSVAVGLIFTVNGTAVAGQGPHGAGARQRAMIAHVRAQGGATSPTHTPDDGDLADEAAQYDFERTAPSGTITGDALTDAQQAALALPETGSGRGSSSPTFRTTRSRVTTPTRSGVTRARASHWSAAGSRP